LALDSPKIIEVAWELLQKIPINKKLYNDLVFLQDAEKGWNNLIDIHSTPKILYSLKIIRQLLD